MGWRGLGRGGRGGEGTESLPCGQWTCGLTLRRVVALYVFCDLNPFRLFSSELDSIDAHSLHIDLYHPEVL